VVFFFVALHGSVRNIQKISPILEAERCFFHETEKEWKLPGDWKSIPHAHAGQELGNSLLKSNQYLGIKMPSVVVPGEYNLILNPNHPTFKAVTIKKKEDFKFDKRLLKIP